MNRNIRQSRNKELQDEICEAKEKATSLSDIEKYEQLEAEIVHEFLSGRIDTQEYEIRLRQLKNDPQRVILLSVDELIYALNFLEVSEDEKKEILEHELDHFNQARASGLQARFCITIYRTDTNRLALICGTQVHTTLDNTLSEDERRIGLRSAIAAPQNPSPTDKQLLQS